jgi:hypothetical protein
MATNKKIMTESEAAEAQESLEQNVANALPPRGYLRHEELARRQDELQREAERVADKMLRGSIDPSQLEIANEIASKTQWMSVSNADPAFVYGWVSKNRHGQHIQAMHRLGWVTVQGEDPEAIELKGTRQGTSLGTTRELGDVVLMKIPRERYIVLKALEEKRKREVQRASTAGLIELAGQYRNNVTVRPYNMEDPYGDLSGPDIRPRNFTSKQGAVRFIQDLREGTVPGMEINR